MITIIKGEKRFVLQETKIVGVGSYEMIKEAKKYFEKNYPTNNYVIKEVD